MSYAKFDIAKIFNNMQLDFETINIGDTLPILVKSPITRTTLALFAGASHDHNPMHIDIDFAQKAGYKDVFAHGMLGMAYLGQVLTNWVDPITIKKFSARFKAITNLGDILTCKGEVVEKVIEEDKKFIQLSLSVCNQHGEEKLAGAALISCR